MELQVTQFADQPASTLAVSEKIFGSDYNEPLIHQVVVAYLAGGRQGTKAQKSRSDVRGGGTKPWRQKGTGRARAGTIRSPLWRTGGVTFAAQPRDHSQKVNKQMYRKALHSILSELVRQERLLIVNDLKMTEAKTKSLLASLKELGAEDKVLLITAEAEKNLLLSARNLHKVAVANAANVDPVSLVAADKVIITVEAVKKLEERLG